MLQGRAQAQPKAAKPSKAVEKVSEKPRKADKEEVSKNTEKGQKETEPVLERYNKYIEALFKKTNLKQTK